MSLYTTKDLAAEMLLHPRTVKRWWRKLNVPPDACSGNACHRWTEAGKARLMRAWRDWWLMRGHTPEAQASKFEFGRTDDPRQRVFIFDERKKTTTISPVGQSRTKT